MMTVNDVAERADTHPRTIHDWVDQGFIEPAERGRAGAGNRHRFTVSQVVALWLAANLKKLGAGREMVKDVLTVLGQMSDEQMKREIDAGIRTYLPGMGFTQPPPGIDIPHTLDLAELYRIVFERFAHLDRVRAQTAKVNA
jgi:DNA-binding transcriptional MerR regulator